MEPIPQPHLLDPDRFLDPQRNEFAADHEARAQMYEDGMREGCQYGQQLWQTLDAVREYLMSSLPPDPRAPDTQVRCASPTGPDDEEGWVRWIDMFSSVTSSLCGPHGDSGFGYGQAREVAQIRRASVSASGSTPVEHRSQDSAARDEGTPDQPADQSAASSSAPKRLRLTAGAVIGLLAVRGLLPRHPRQRRR